MVALTWNGHQLVLAYLFAVGSDAVELHPGLAPGHDVYAPRRTEARVFERRVRIPPGTSDVYVGSDCGEANTTVDVPSEGDVPSLVVPLPG